MLDTETISERELKEQTELLFYIRRWVRVGGIALIIIAGWILNTILLGFDVMFKGFIG